MPPIFAIFVLYGLGLTASMQVGLVGPIAPDLRAGFDLSQAQFGLVASLITAAGALLRFPQASGPHRPDYAVRCFWAAS